VISFRLADLQTDLAALARLLSLVSIDPYTAEDVNERWQGLDEETRFAHLAVDEQGQGIGMAELGRNAWTPPGVLRLTLIVDPAWRNQGIGSQLFSDGFEVARAKGARCLESMLRDDDPHSLHFAGRRGYRLDRHIFDSTLDLTTFEEQPFVERLERAQAAGFRFFTLADLEPLSEEVQRKLYELNRVTALDNPANNGNFLPFEEFRKEVLEASWFRPDGQILAAQDERWVGLAAVAWYPQAGYAYNAFTGVDRAYRGQGLALALKLLAVRCARQYGAPCLRTSNDSRNAPMLAINRKLGYQPLRGVCWMALDLA